MSLTKITSTVIADSAITPAKISNDVSLGIKIANVSIANSIYDILDDTAISTDGGYIVITGSGFASGAQVLIEGTAANSTTFVSDSELRAQVPAKSAGSYNVYVVNSDGATGIRVNGLTYSANPAWVTGGTLDNQAVDVAFSVALDATDAVSYANSTALPAGTALLSNGYFYGTVTGIEEETTYTFTVVATDAENQDSPRTFSVTVTVAPPIPNIENASYDSVSANLSAEMTSVLVGLWFEPTGTKMFICEAAGGGIKRYTLSTPFDITSRTYDQTLDSSPLCVWISSDGTKLFYGGVNGTFSRYSLSTPFDLNSATNIGNFQSEFADETVGSLNFNDDGTYFYMFDVGGRDVRRYVLGTPYDFNTRISSNTYDFTGFMSSLSASYIGIAINFSYDGSKLYFSHKNTTTNVSYISQFSLTTPWDITTLTYDNISVNLSGVVDSSTNVRNVVFNNNSTKMFVPALNKIIYQYSI